MGKTVDQPGSEVIIERRAIALAVRNPGLSISTG
jgi:hypothetical protein